jgi:hypothetical protein
VRRSNIDSTKGTGGEVANALVCKTSIRGFNSRPVLQARESFQLIPYLPKLHSAHKKRSHETPASACEYENCAFPAEGSE